MHRKFGHPQRSLEARRRQINYKRVPSEVKKDHQLIKVQILAPSVDVFYLFRIKWGLLIVQRTLKIPIIALLRSTTNHTSYLRAGSNDEAKQVSYKILNIYSFSKILSADGQAVASEAAEM